MIVRAAIKYYIRPLSKEVILPLHRHFDGSMILKELGYESWDFDILEQGFLTSDGDFLDRKEALEYALKSGQISEDDPWDIDVIASGQLMSEDLW